MYQVHPFLIQTRVTGERRENGAGGHWTPMTLSMRRLTFSPSRVRKMLKMGRPSLLLLALSAFLCVSVCSAAPEGYVRLEKLDNTVPFTWTNIGRSSAHKLITLQVAVKQSNVDQLLVRLHALLRHLSRWKFCSESSDPFRLCIPSILVCVGPSLEP